MTGLDLAVGLSALCGNGGLAFVAAFGFVFIGDSFVVESEPPHVGCYGLKFEQRINFFGRFLRSFEWKLWQGQERNQVRHLLDSDGDFHQ